MNYVSTRGAALPVGLSAAIRHGAAPDGGLYMPAHVPAIDWAALTPEAPLADFAAALLAPFFAGDPLERDLPAIARAAFDFPVPIVTPDPARPSLRALELFHGPTGAFKDFGARFLLGCFDRIGDPAGPIKILVATSGDTGGAVGCAAEGRDAVEALILYPKGRVSAFQEHQLTCWRPPVRAVEVDGDFDDCQRLVKAAFADPEFAALHRLTSANSINIGRLLPQIAYLAHAALRAAHETGTAPSLIIPTGNLGHAFAAVYARALGAPIGRLVAVTNANRTLGDWHATGRFDPRPSVATIANAMDVGSPSNFERLVALPPDARGIGVEAVDDATIRARIAADHAACGHLWDPHAATAAEAFARLPAADQALPWLIAATAHPFKFADVLAPIVPAPIAPPPALAAIAGRPTRKLTIPPTLDALRTVLARPAED